MKRTLVISDIHGCYDEFNELLDLTQYNPEEDKLLLLGDYCDRGLKSKQVIERVMFLVNKCNAIALRGNHDQMMLNALEKYEDQLWLMNGGLQAVESYVGLNWFEDGYNYGEYLEAKEFIKQHYQHHIDFIKTLPVYYEDDEYIYAHAGLHPMYENWKEQPTENFLWIRDVFLNNPTTVEKTVIFGHTPTINIHDNEDIWFGEDKIGIDCGCVFGFQLGCLEIGDEGYKTYFIPKGGR